MFLIDLAHALRGVGEFIDDDGGDDPLEAAGFDLGEKLPARSVDPRIEDAAADEVSSSTRMAMRANATGRHERTQ